MTLRATTNLVVPKDLQLPRKELKSGFLYVYNKGYTGLEPIFINKLWISSLFPSIAADPKFGKNRKQLRAFVDSFLKKVPAGTLSIKKINDPIEPHFVVSFPIGQFSNDTTSAVSFLSNALLGGPAPDQAHSEAQALTDALHEVQTTHNISASTVIDNFKGLDAKAKIELSHTLLGLRVKAAPDNVTVFADFTITKPVAEQLTTTPWLEIRPIDMYPILLQWTAGYFGYNTHTPLAAFPISKIARTLPPVQEGQARVNENNLSIGPDGTVYWLPRKLDNTGRYEDLYSQVGHKADGSFQLVDTSAPMVMNTGGPVAGLPVNIPVLIDWVNNKFSYTTTTGTLKIQELVRFKTADMAHIDNILNRGIEYAQLRVIINMGVSSGVAGNVELKDEEKDEIEAMGEGGEKLLGESKLQDYTVEALALYRIQEEMQAEDPIPMRLLTVDGPVVLRPIARFILKAHAAILSNLEAVNEKYAVSTVSTHLALATLVAKYCTDLAGVTLGSNKIRSAALGQGVDRKWVPPSVPMLSDRIGLLPHQKKVRNLLKDSPDFAILPIQAGGGKTVIAITDVLYEIKANRSQPYLILCPPHLVAQYVREIVFFTSGKLNVVAITSYAISYNGFDRLTKILEAAPRNTVVVCDYDVLRYRQQQVCYGTTNVPVYPVIEFLRQFNFGYALLDESHSVKNDTARTRACMALIADIPKKRLASGTMAHDSPSDLALQIAMLDPTLFGSRSDFNERFGAVVRGDRVIKWKPGAQRAIMQMIKSRIVVAGAMRKEWAALLPKANENFIGVDLTPEQHRVYNMIFELTLEKLREEAKTNRKLAKFLGVAFEGDEELTDEEKKLSAVDEEEDDDLATLLNPYLARIEQFVTAPGRDELGAKMLSGDDLLSPKVTEVIKCIRTHLEAKHPGKVLVFTNYTDSAEEIYDQLPPDLKKQALHYIAAEKVETGAAFEKDDSKTIMIGVEQSMNTGLNLQHVSRLIRVENVWNPGTLEQGNSRVNRPELKKADRRTEIWYDWIVANKTIDITKVGRLISKIIAIAKFENADSPEYDTIPDVEVIKMDLDSVQTFNDWHSNLKEYAVAYQRYNEVKADDYADYKEKYEAEFGELKLEALPAAPTPKDAALMKTVPYTPGLDIYGTDQLGLVRLDEYLRQDAMAETADDEDEEEGDTESAESAQREEVNRKLVGQPIHTEFGDGIIKSINFAGRKVRVSLPAGYSIYVRNSAAFVFTRPTTSTKDIRNQLLKSVGDMPLTAPIEVPAVRFRVDTMALRKAEKEKTQKEKEKLRTLRKKAEDKLSVELSFSIANGFLGITYFVDEKNQEAKAALQALGFRPTPQFAYAQLKNANQLVKQFNVWEAAGFTLDKEVAGVSPAFQDLHRLLKAGKIAGHNIGFKFSTRNQLINFYRKEAKPSVSTYEIKPYPMIEDNVAYIVLPLRGQPASRKAILKKAPGIRWKMSSESLIFYGLTLQSIGNKIKEIMEAGIEISNVKDLSREFKKLKKTAIRNKEDIHLL